MSQVNRNEEESRHGSFTVGSVNQLAENFINNVREVTTRVHGLAKYNGFWDNAGTSTKGEKIALMHSELSEALEAIRKPVPMAGEVEEELADCVIRIMDYCGYHDISLGRAIVEKHAKNLERPFKHGKAF